MRVGRLGRMRVSAQVLGSKEVVRLVKNRAQLTDRQGERIAEGLVRALNGPDSYWPRKGGGVAGGASGASRKRFEGRARAAANGDLDIFLTNTSTGRDRARALGKKGGSRKRYARYPEAGIPNPSSAKRAERTIRKVLPRVLTRVLGPGWNTKPGTGAK